MRDLSKDKSGRGSLPPKLEFRPHWIGMAVAHPLGCPNPTCSQLLGKQEATFRGTVSHGECEAWSGQCPHTEGTGTRALGRSKPRLQAGVERELGWGHLSSWGC